MNAVWRSLVVTSGLALAVGAGWAGRATLAIPTSVHTGMAGMDGMAHMASMDEPIGAARLEPSKTGCRQGAFVEAASIINSVVDIALALPSDTSAQTRAVLDTVLTTVIKQAHSEVHCVAGGLRFGYQHTYAETMRHGVMLAKARGLPQDLIRIGNQVALSVERNQAVPSPAAR